MDKVQQEHERLVNLFKEQNADENKLLTYDRLILECARATIQLDGLSEIAEKTGLVKVHPDYPDLQKPLPVATELTKVRASLTNMLTKLDRMLGTNVTEDFDDLEEFV